MKIGHWVGVCLHGFVVEQCRCPGEKTIRVVACTDPAECMRRINHLELPDEATIIMETGVYHETKGDVHTDGPM